MVIEAKQQPPLLTDEENITLRQSIHLQAKAALLKSKKNIYTRTQTHTRYCKQQQKWGNGERRAANRISSGHHNSDFNSMLSQKKKEKSRCIKKGETIVRLSLLFHPSSIDVTQRVGSD